jgi:soluble lytic murein transglycosylase-like protein
MLACACTVGGLFALTSSGQAIGCWAEAATRIQINPNLLYAIAKCESDLRPTALNRTGVGTYDIGLMQINSSHLRKLASFGITERQLYDDCTNIHVGAWILAEMIRRHGFSWEAIGAYNAACTQRRGKACEAARSKYSWCVYRNLPKSASWDFETSYAASFGTSTPMTPLIAIRVAR